MRGMDFLKGRFILRCLILSVFVLMPYSVFGANVLRIGVGIDADSLNPHEQTTTLIQNICDFMYDTLFYQNEKGEAVPMLATGKSVSKDGLVWTFTLRKGVKFHDGTPFTAEAVKVALIKDRSFFSYLYEQRFELAAFSPRPMEEMVHRCAALHMHHIGSGGDPFELGSARPLDFGHWSAHKLEEMTGGLLRHGEAVSIGIALDSLYSYYVGMIEESELLRIFTLLGDLGLPLYHPALAALDMSAALDEFREHLGGELAITLLTGIGGKKEVDRIELPLMARCVNELLSYDGSRGNRLEQTGSPAPLCGESP